MQIAQVLAGYSLGQADLLRRAMGKKKAEEMARARSVFVEGAKGKGVDGQLAEEIFDLLAQFADYGFNRSHSAAYAIVTYQTAWLKRHYPHEFIAGLMSCDKDNTDNIVKFIAEARAMGIPVERPDVNESVSDFGVAVQDGRKVVRFGLGAVRGVGEGAVEVILAARREGGPFKSLYDFCERVDTQKVNRRVVEALIKAGAFDGLARRHAPRPLMRAQLFEALENALERAASAQRDRRSGQTSLFGLVPSAAVEPERYPDLEEWAPKQLLAFEKESLGFYITGHPLDRFQADISRYANVHTGELEKVAGKDTAVSIGGVVADYRDKPTKSGNGRVAFFKIEDQYGQVNVVVFPKVYEKVHPILTSDEPLLVTGKIVDEGEGETSDYKLFLDEAVPLAQLREQKTREVHLHLNADSTSARQLEELKGVLAAHSGPCRVFLHLRIPMRSETILAASEDLSVTPSDELLLRLDRLFGERVALLR